MAFSVVLQGQSFMFFVDSGFFAKQMDHFCKAKGLQLQGKRTTVVGQKDSFCNKMKLFVSYDDCAFGLNPSQPIMYQQHITNRSKLTNFAPKDFLVRSARSFERLEMQILYRRGKPLLL